MPTLMRWSAMRSPPLVLVIRPWLPESRGFGSSSMAGLRGGAASVLTLAQDRDQRADPEENREQAETGGERAGEEGGQAAVLRDHRLHEALLDDRADHHAQDQRRDGIVVLLHEEGDDARAQGDGDAHHGIIDGE